MKSSIVLLNPVNHSEKLFLAVTLEALETVEAYDS